MNSHLEHILIKFLSKSANASELDMLEDWVKAPENERTFKAFVKTHYEITYGMAPGDSRNRSEKLLLDIQKKKHKRRQATIIGFLKYTALILVMVGCGYLIRNFFTTKNETMVTNREPKQITLELEDGTIRTLSDEDDSINVANAKGIGLGTKKGRMLLYNTGEADNGPVYNTLGVPYGKRFDLTLSDGSTVFLNAGSKLRYPVSFPKKGNRQVYLVGEAFFNISPNNKKPFVIIADELDVKVLGTIFNMANYPEDDTSEVVLVEGTVSLSTKQENGETHLRPGQKGSLHKNSGKLSAETVSVEVYTSWVDGKLVFRNMTFERILKRLERHYDVSISNGNKTLAREKFNANFGNEPLKRVLEYFETTYGIEYAINGKEISIE